MYIVNQPLAELCNARGCLKDELGRYDKVAGTPLIRDALHLGKSGLRILAKVLKFSVVGRYKSSNSHTGQHGASAGSHQDGYQPSG